MIKSSLFIFLLLIVNLSLGATETRRPRVGFNFNYVGGFVPSSNEANITGAYNHQIAIGSRLYFNRFLHLQADILFSILQVREELLFTNLLDEEEKRENRLNMFGGGANALLGLRMPLFPYFAIGVGLGWFFTAVVDPRREREHRTRYGHGPLFRLGLEIGAFRSGAVYGMLGYNGRYDFWLARFVNGFYAGIGFRL